MKFELGDWPWKSAPALAGRTVFPKGRWIAGHRAAGGLDGSGPQQGHTRDKAVIRQLDVKSELPGGASTASGEDSLSALQ